MRKILAIAGLTIRNSIRSRIFTPSVVLVLLATSAFPLILIGDGTIQGHVRVMIDYSIRVLTYSLVASTVWTAVRTSTAEIEERQMWLLITKPVTTTDIWFGKWLGVLAMNACLLFVAGTALLATVKLRFRPSKLTAQELHVLSTEILVARSTIEPDCSELQEEARQLTEAILSRPGGRTSSREATLASAQSEIEKKRNRVAPGDSREWRFHVDKTSSADRSLFVSFNISSPRQLEMKPLTVEWHAGTQQNRLLQSYRDDIFPSERNSFLLSSSISRAGKDILVEYVNAQTNPPSTVLFHDKTGVSILQNTASFESNLVRAMMIIFCQLALFAALGLTIGSLFSMPVAVFVSFAVILIFMLGGFISMTVAENNSLSYHPFPSIRWLDPFVRAEFRIFNAILAPVRHWGITANLPRGEVIPWSEVATAFAIQVVALSGLTGIVGAWLLKKRELGAPCEV